jgi:hypothetical protein
MNTFTSYKNLLIIILITSAFISFAQPTLPLRSLSVTVTQGIHFGTFCVTGGSGGTIILGSDGIRSATGEIILLDVPPIAQPAIFELKLCLSRTVYIYFDPPEVQLTGTGGTLKLRIGPTDKGDNGAGFLINSDCNYVTTLRVGGTLTATAASHPGNYSGTFAINFLYQ